MLSEYEHEPNAVLTDLKQIKVSDLTLFYSKSVAYLFQYLKYNVFVYLGLSFLSLLTFVPQVLHVLFLAESTSWKTLLVNLFFISEFPKDQAWAPWTQWCLSSILFLLCFLCYSYIVGKKQIYPLLGERINDFLQQEDPRESFYSELNRINHNARTLMVNYSCRWSMSVLCFLLVLSVYTAIQGSIQYWILIQYPNSFIMSFVGSLIHTCFKSIWRKMCWILTRWEMHDFWDRFYTFYFIKVYLFDVSSFCIFYLTRTVLTRYVPSDLSSICHLDWMAQQFLWVLFLDYLGFRLAECFVAEIQNMCCVVVGRKMNLDHSDEWFRYKFILVEEYVKIVLRQYYVLAGFLLIPVLPWMALLLSLFDYWRCLYKLIRLCERPRPCKNSFSGILFLSAGVNFVLATFSYPGLIWYFLVHVDLQGCSNTRF